MPKLSVILPVKNGQNYVGAAVRSTLRALPRDSELVVLDDHSTDDTRALLEDFHDRRLRVLVRRQGTGLSGALNELIECTDSEYIARMDADDLVLPWRFGAQLARLQTGDDFCFGTVLHWKGRIAGIRPTRVDPIDGAVMGMLLLMENPVAHSTAVFRRQAIDRLGGYRDVLSEDYDLWLRAASEGYRMCRIGLPVLLYRHHPSQVTADEGWKLRSRVEKSLIRAHMGLAHSLFGIKDDCMSGIRASEPSLEQRESTMRLIAAIDTRISEGLEGKGIERLKRSTLRNRLNVNDPASD